MRIRSCIALGVTTLALLAGCAPLTPKTEESSAPPSAVPAPVIDAAPPGGGMETVLEDVALVVFTVYDGAGRPMAHPIKVIVTATPVEVNGEAYIIDPVTGYEIPSPDIMPAVMTPLTYRSHLLPDMLMHTFTGDAIVPGSKKLACWVERNGQIVPGSLREDISKTDIDPPFLSVTCVHRRAS